MTKLLGLAAPILGLLALLLCGGEPPTWLLRLECVLFSVAALVFGFTRFTLSTPAWLFSKPIRGVACIYLGSAAMFVDPRFLFSAFFIGLGTRLILASDKPRVVIVPSTGLRREAGDIVLCQDSRDLV